MTEVSVPTVSKTKDVAIDSGISGALGGIGYGLGYSFAGPLGAAAGSVVAGAARGGTGGKIVATNGVMDLIASLLMGGAGAGQAQGGAI